jgi:hypothetical protein
LSTIKNKDLMNTNQLKRFAQAARLKLIDQIGAKLEKVLTSDSTELREKASEIKQLQEAINSSSKQQVVDTVAYTWFNRFVALRFMDVNGYEPINIKVVSPLENATLPELLQEAKAGNIPQELPVNHQRIYQILDGTIPSSNAQNEAYRELLVGACNHLHTIFPFLFERINDYSELLLPDDLISEFSIVEDIKNGMPREDSKEVEILGWLYQFYISGRKKEVSDMPGKVKKEDIPAATQLFTPRWIVEYMVQNTVGKLWLQNNPKSKLRDHMPYYIESPSVTADDYLKIDSVEEITLLDQACGSGHILVYGFELLSKIYEEEGYNKSDIPTHIIEKNLYGFEIDTRAAQLSGLALMLKARQYYRRVFKKDIIPNIYCYQDLKVSKEDIKATFIAVDEKLSDALLNDLTTMQQATNLGSLIIPHTDAKDLEKISVSLADKANNSDLFNRHNLMGILQGIVQLSALSRKYHCVVDNPPYMTSDNFNKELFNYSRLTYGDSYYDLMAAFMEAGLFALKPKGYLGMINQHSWMFLSSYTQLREKIIAKNLIENLLHLGPRTFPEISGEVVQSASFVIKKDSIDSEGVYLRLTKLKSTEIKRKNTIQILNGELKEGIYNSDQNLFQNIPTSRIGYWFNKDKTKVFKHKKLGELQEVKAGVLSGKDPFFVKNWTEVMYKTIGFNLNAHSQLLKINPKWVPITNGGSFRRWYGNLVNIMDFKNDAENIRNRPKNNFRLRAKEYYFIQGINWTLQKVRFSVRESPEGVLFGNGSRTIFTPESDFHYIIGLFNSNVVEEILSLYNPTTNFVNEDIKQVPVLVNESIEIKSLVKTNISISKNEWNSRELSWDFLQNELIRIKGQDLEEAYDSYCHYWQNKFMELHKNEEALNKQFIDIYGLQDELIPDVPLEDITILKEETSIVNNQLVFNAKEVMQQFVSYALGCMFGRYSLDKPGLIIANQGETLEDYLNVIASEGKQFASFLPDDDNIIPILDNEWFEDDIVGRFYEFLKVTFGKESFEKNLAFVEESLGKDIRKYFLKDFYIDHIKRYKKRPIYWQFSSPSGAFNVLIYMHRYTPDTLNQILNGYLKDYREKLTAELDRQAHLKNVGTAREQTLAQKEEDRIDKVLLELQEYERELYKLATERIAIDLDDGVFVNYNKFGEVIKTVKGLNDKKAKDKVKKFDWIDVKEIR